MKHKLFTKSVLVLTLLTSCGTEDTPNVMDNSAGMMSTAGSSTSGSSTSTSGGDQMNSTSCTAQVEIGFFSDPECTQPVMAAEPTRIYDTTQDCFGWEGNSAAGENSATRFQCFRDRLCYTQHPASLTCGNGSPTNKEARTDECVLDTQTPDGSRAIYAKIISGTESCPEAPADFECPLSEPQRGTSGISACTMEP